MSHRHICVHGHFYQPPRENPWTGAVEREDAAAPFHDWNARIAEECYGPMTLGVHEGLDGSTIGYDETLKRLSYDIGPTLMSWLERERPSILKRILAADAATQTAIAHPYFHNIMPLESRRDKETLVRWGLAEFRRRYGRDAEGMWLPETAVDDETLEVLAGAGVAFTILDPKQAAAFRNVGGTWTDVDAERLDPKTPYLWTSPKDPSKKLAIFFYHRRLSRGVVTGETLAGPEGFAEAVRQRLLTSDGAQLVQVVSDGEFYGHHHRRIGRVLALTLDLLESEGIEPIGYARFLGLFPPPREVKIRERTAWSCEHGLGRWERDCGCRSEHLPNWKQDWRAPLRTALNRLAKGLDGLYEARGAHLFIDPWKARDEYIELWLTPGREAQAAFLKKHAGRVLSPEDEALALRLQALQRERLAMFTSCGWFFDDISGAEAVICLQRAARALDLAKSFSSDLEGEFIEGLRTCRSNLPRYANGAEVWTRLVVRGRFELERAAAHAAILDHLELLAAAPPLLRWEFGPRFRADKAGLAGRDRTLSIRPVYVSCPETRESAEFHALVHRADRLDLACWIIPRSRDADAAVIGTDFLRLSDDDFRASLDAAFGSARYGLDALLGDERSEVVKALSQEGPLGYERSVFLKRWNACVSALRRGENEDDSMLELLAQMPAHLFRLSELPWFESLEERMHSRFDAVANAPFDATLISCALRWFDALQKDDRITQTWRLRDAQRRWRDALDHEPGAALDACRALGSRLGLAESALNTL